MLFRSDDGVAGADITITDSMGPLTWTPIVGSAAGDSVGWGYAARAFISSATTGAGSMTVTVDCGAFSAYAYAVIVDALGGEDASPLGATATGSDADADGSLSITLNGTPASTSQLFAALIRAESSDGGVVTPGTGWTEEAEAREIGWFAFQAQRRTGTTSTTVTWDDIAANAGQAGALALALVTPAEAQKRSPDEVVGRLYSLCDQNYKPACIKLGLVTTAFFVVP